MSYLTLYRKYRPKNFNEIVGQLHVVKTLQNALKTDKVAHAYLFCGPRGVGKTTIARLLAKAINCSDLRTKDKVESCNKCDQCQTIINNKAVDIIEIDAASNRGIDEIRELREKIKFTPNFLKYKVFIIDEVHMLTIEAFNALLKTLEEPPSHAIFILATTEAHKIPATILSRCQRFDFMKLTHNEIVEQLSNIADKEKVSIDDKSLSLIASNSSGSSRDALSLLNQVISLEDSKITFEETKSILGITDMSEVLDLMDSLIAKDTKKSIEKISELVDSGYDLEQFFKSLIEYLRKLLLFKVSDELIGNKGSNLTDEQIIKLKQQADKLLPQDLIFYINNFIKSKKEIDDSIIPQLPFEIAIINITGGNINNVQKEVIQSKKQVLQKEIKNDVHEDVEKKKKNSIVKTQSKKNIEEIREAEKEVVSERQKKNTNIKISPEVFNTLKKDWLGLIKSVSNKNVSLGSFLGACEPLEIRDGKIMLMCKYSFHKEKLKDLKNKQIIEDEAEKLFKTNVLFDLVLYNDLSSDLKKKIDKESSKSKEESNKTTPDLAKQALNVFGGSVA